MCLVREVFVFAMSYRNLVHLIDSLVVLTAWSFQLLMSNRGLILFLVLMVFFVNFIKSSFRVCTLCDCVKKEFDKSHYKSSFWPCSGATSYRLFTIKSTYFGALDLLLRLITLYLF